MSDLIVGLCLGCFAGVALNSLADSLGTWIAYKTQPKYRPYARRSSLPKSRW